MNGFWFVVGFALSVATLAFGEAGWRGELDTLRRGQRSLRPYRRKSCRR